MSAWNKTISWSTAKVALSCPWELKFTDERRPYADTYPTYHRVLGRTVQFIFEQFWKQEMYKDPRARTAAIFEKFTDKIIASEWFHKQPLWRESDQTLEQLKKDIHTQVQGGFQIFAEMDLLDKPIQSEVRWSATFRGFRLRGAIDFLLTDPDQTALLLDGKGTAKEDAPPGQLQFYQTMLLASNITVKRMGFAYWKFGRLVEVDTNPAVLKEFWDGDLSKAMQVFNDLANGVELQPTPSPKTCGRCNWKSNCPASVYLRPESSRTGETASFDES